MRQVGEKVMHVVDKIKGGEGHAEITAETYTASNLSKPLFSIAELY